MKPSFSLPLRKTKRQKVISQVLHNRYPQPAFIDNLRMVAISWTEGIGIPLISVGIAFILKLQFGDIVGVETPFLLFFAPIIISSWYAGFYSGIIATVLGAFGGGYFFLVPEHIRSLSQPQVASFLIYILEGIFISYLIELERRGRAALSESERRFKLLVENATDYAIIFFDPLGYLSNWNKGAEKLFGYNKTDVLHKHFSVLFTDQDRQQQLPQKEYKEALTKDKSSDENYLKKKDGNIFWASGTTTSLWDKKDNLRGFVKIIRDATAMKENEKQKDDFISVAAHELRTPVASIQIFAQLLQKYYANNPPPNEPKKYLEKLTSQINKLTELMGTLLDMSRMQQGKVQLHKERVDVTKLIDETIENVQATTSTHKLVRMGKVQDKITLDRRRIEEVITNLFTNAIKYSPKAQKVIVRITPERNFVRISVQDFGIGIPKENIEKVFERFYRASNSKEGNIPGMGLGLYISFQIIKAHGGIMQVKSTPGKGSTFSFTLPLK